jgi:hypothetical protein
MKALSHSLLVLLTAITAAAAHAQQDRPKALFDSLAFSGGFFGFNMRYTQVLGTDAVLLGLSGGIVVHDRLNIGLAGTFNTSLLKNTTYERFLNDSLGVNTQGGLEFNFGYGGLLIEPVIFHRSAIHATVPVLIGAGGATYGYPLPGSDSSDRRSKVAGQAFFAVDAGLEVEVTVVPRFRIGLGASYLYTSDLSLPETKPDALRVPMYRLTMKYAAP